MNKNVKRRVILVSENAKKPRIVVETLKNDDNNGILTSPDVNIVDEPEENVVEEETTGNNEKKKHKVQVQFELGTTNKGGNCLWKNGFRYITSSHGYWRCSNRDCPATAKASIENGLAVGTILIARHNHEPDVVRKSVELRRAQIKRKIMENPAEKPAKIIEEVNNNTDPFVDQHFQQPLSRTTALTHMMIRMKKKARKSMISLRDEPTVNKEGEENILLYDSNEARPNERDAVLAFSHPKLIDLLRRNRHWLLDLYSFKSLPRPFIQCLAIGAFVKDSSGSSRVTICVHVLLPGRQERYYAEAFEALKAALHPIWPQRIFSDFDTSLIGAAQAIFPRCLFSGSLLHMGLNLWQNWKELGLEPLLLSDGCAGRAARQTFRRLLALPLVPVEHVRRTFSLIIDAAPLRLAPFLCHFAEQYIGLVQVELHLGAAAFRPGILIRVQQPETETQHQRRGRGQAASTICGQDQREAPKEDFLRWQLPIESPPRYAMEFWNLNESAESAMARMDFAMVCLSRPEKRAIHRPSLEQFISDLRREFNKQLNNNEPNNMGEQFGQGTAAMKLNRWQHHTHNVSQKQQQQQMVVQRMLELANWEEDGELLELVSQLGENVQNYMFGLDDYEEEWEQNGDDVARNDELEATEAFHKPNSSGFHPQQSTSNFKF